MITGLNLIIPDNVDDDDDDDDDDLLDHLSNSQKEYIIKASRH